MQPKSDNLFHFTKSIQVLKLILKNGFEPRYCLEDVEWFGIDEIHVAYAVSCFCDIPLSRISDHNKFYGNYGIGMTKDWGLRNGLEPVIYLRPDGRAASCINYLTNKDITDLTAENNEKESAHLFNLLKLIKPLSGTMVIDKEFVQKDFFQENEWRYAPLVDDIIGYRQYDARKDKENLKIAKEFKLSFTPQDIKYIFVNDDNEIPELVDFINDSKNFGHYPSNDLKILQTRIISLNTIAADL